MSDQHAELHLLNCFLRGHLSRREMFLRGVALGVGVSTLAALSTFDVQAAQDSAPAGEITWGLESNVPNVIPFGGIATATWWGKEFMYDSLLAWDADLNVIPALAESWETSDSITYTFKLREGVKFHDGGEMTSKDVVYSINLAVNPIEPGIKVPYLANIATAEAIDDYNIKITMSKTDPTLIGTLAWTVYTPIVPEGMLDRVEVLSNGIGTGPFKLVEYSQDDQIVYEAFSEFWEPGIPKIQKLTLKMSSDAQQRVAALRAGELDGAPFSADVASTLASDEISIQTGISAAARVISLLMVNDVPWRDKRVRQAISLVIDRQEIIEKAYGGQAFMSGAIPPGFGPWPLTDEQLAAAYSVDVEKAKQLMADGGFADGFDVSLMAIAQPQDYVQIAEIIQQQVKQIGINCSVEPLEIGTFVERANKGEYEWASTGRGIRGDPSGHLIDFRSGTSSFATRFGDGWKSDEFDALYDEGLTTSDPARRKEIYDQLQEVMLDELPNIYTVVPMRFQATRSRVQDMYVFYGGTNLGLRTATVAE